MGLPIKFLKSTQTRLDDEEALRQQKSAKKAKLGKSVYDIIEAIRRDIDENLSYKKEMFRIVTDYDELKAYVLAANKYGMVAIDTETTSLDVYHMEIVGLSMYFPGEKAIYVPINHLSYLTNERIPEQLNEEQVRSIFKLLTAKIIMHNAPFDIRVILHTIGIMLHCWWDTQAGAFLLGEEESHRLKDWHSAHISHVVEKTFEDYFKGIDFQIVSIELAYMYAANDALDTFECYELQAKFLNDDPNNREDRRNVYWVFANIEMPMVEVIVELEENGVCVDKPLLKYLQQKYHKMEAEALKVCYEQLYMVEDKINAYKLLHPRCKLEDPINFGSSDQLATLFYDILECDVVDEEHPRSVDVDALNEIAAKYDQPIIKSILKYRTAQKLNSTYLDSIVDRLDENGRIHAGFKSMGAKTGRMSSKNPNLQNIPSSRDYNEIRQMYVGEVSYRNVDAEEGVLHLNREEEVELLSGEWKWVELLEVGDRLSDGAKVCSVNVEEFTVDIEVMYV